MLVAIGVAYGATIRSADGGRPDDETSAMAAVPQTMPATCLGFLHEKSVTEGQNYHQRLSESHSANAVSPQRV